MNTVAAEVRKMPMPEIVADANELMTIREHSLPLTLDSGAMDSMVRLAEIMATGKATVPVEYRGNPGDCLAVVMQAVQWKMNPYAVAQKTYFVSGKIGYEAQLINAVITALAPTKDRIHYEWYGPWENVIGKFIEKTNSKGETYRKCSSTLADEKGVGIKVWATLKGEDEPRILNLMMSQAGTRNSTLWADDPRQQLAYLAVKRWARLYTPDVIMGVYTPEELEEITPGGERDMGPADVVKEKLGTPQNKQRLERAPTLAEVLKLIAKATTADDMESASTQASKIVDSQEKVQARTAFKARLAELKAAAAQQQSVDMQTGEIKTDQPGATIEGSATSADGGAGDTSQSNVDGKSTEADAPAFTYETLLQALQNATAIKTLDDLAKFIGDIDDFDRRNNLDKAYQARRFELSGAKVKK